MEAAFALPLPASARKTRWRIRLTYWWRHGCLPQLDAPQTFTELVQARKLLPRDPALARAIDKVAVKPWVAARLGADWVVPSLWHGRDLPVDPPWPMPFVVKARHGCNQTAFVFDMAGWRRARRLARRWANKRYGYWLDEHAYADIPRGIVVEPFLGLPPTLPIDYKFYVFGGRVAYVQVHLGRGVRHRWVLLDRDWTRVSAPTDDPDPAAPSALAAMIAAAERLAEHRDFVRVDLYEIDGRPLFGELTFFPGSGLDRFTPKTLDAELGARWLRALGQAPASVNRSS